MDSSVGRLLGSRGHSKRVKLRKRLGDDTEGVLYS